MSVIVVGFDGSERSHDALALARDLAAQARAGLLLAIAVPYPALALVGEGIAVAVTRQGAATGARVLDDEVAALAADGIDAEGVVRSYDSPPQLLQSLAQERGAALIVVGSACSGRLGRVLPGRDRRAPAGRRSVPGRRRPVRLPAQRRPGPRTPRRRRVRRIRRGARRARGGRGDRVEPRRHARGDRGARRVPLRRARAHGRARLPPHARGRRGRRARAARRRARRPAAGALRERPSCSPGTPRGSWLERSRDLHLLIAGSRGYGPGRAVLLGGVSGRLVRDSACALIVVPRAEPHPLAALRPVAADAVPDR